MENQKNIDIVIHLLKILLSVLSFSSILITFIKAISNGYNALEGMPITMFIYFLTKGIECIERILNKERILGKISAKINTANIVISFLFISANLVFSFINVLTVVLLVFVIFDLVAVIYYLTIDILSIIPKLISYQNI